MTLFTEPKIFAKDLDVIKYQNMMSLNLGNDPLRKEGSSNLCDTQYILHDSYNNYLNITLLFLKGIDNFRKQAHFNIWVPVIRGIAAIKSWILHSTLFSIVTEQHVFSWTLSWLQHSEFNAFLFHN